jgi:RimJ/RimL family protein N-acetyltransferase
VQPPIIRTARLVLRPLTIEDAEVLFNYRSDERVFRYQSWRPVDCSEAEQFIQTFSQGNFGVANTWFQLGLYFQDTLGLIGDLGLHFLDEAHQAVEIGFTIAPEFQRQGFAYEAVREIFHYVFSILDKHRVTASVDPRNLASIALLERLGMRKEALFRQSLLCRGEWVDDAVYAILRSEWASKPSGNPPLT